jgi:hypothetical protein
LRDYETLMEADNCSNDAVTTSTSRLLPPRVEASLAFARPIPGRSTRAVVTNVSRNGEKLAELPKLPGGSLHAQRRLCATEPKTLPDVDVAEAGDCTGTKAMKTAHQHASPSGGRPPSMLVEERVVTEVVLVRAPAREVVAALGWAREGIPSLVWSTDTLLEPERQRVTLTADRPNDILDVIELLRRQFGAHRVSSCTPS